MAARPSGIAQSPNALGGSPDDEWNVFRADRQASGKPLMADFIGPRFNLGRNLATPGAVPRAIQQAGQSPPDVLDRHVRGDWGIVSASDSPQPAVEKSLPLPPRRNCIRIPR